MSTEDTKDKKKSDFGKILETHDEIQLPKVGDLIEGVIVSIGKNEVILDYKGIASGLIRGKEIHDESDVSSNFKVGDTAKATVLEMDNEKGYMELSFRYAGHQQAWENLEELMRDEEVVKAKVMDANKGGLMVKVGNVLGFLPVSQLTTKYYPRVEGGDKGKILGHLKSFISEEFNVAIIDVDEKDSKLIVSQKAALADDQKKTLSEYKVGKKIEGKITGVAGFGAFVEFGDNLEGLVHISELAWQRIDNPNDVVKVGDRVKAEIISVEGGRISLSMKRLIKDPWAIIAEKYKVGDQVKGKVLKINPFGAFVELDKDIHGLAHISELTSHIINSPEDVVTVGEEYTFVIINLDTNKHRLGLSLKVLKEKKVDSNKEKTEEAQNKKKESSSATSFDKSPKVKKASEDKETKLEAKEVKEEPEEPENKITEQRNKKVDSKKKNKEERGKE
jgi:small subunit ribosomal protein S1